MTNGIQGIYEAIATEGFSERVLQLIDEYVNDIQNGTRDFLRACRTLQGRSGPHWGVHHRRLRDKKPYSK